MPYIFKVNGNAALASRLRQKLNLHRERDWTNYVNQVSKVYQQPKDKFDSAHTAMNLERYDRKLLLIRKKMEDIQPVDLQGNYGYVLGTEVNQVYLIVPMSPIVFEQVKNEIAAAHIYTLISQKNSFIQEATWDEMDSILDAFHDEHVDENPEPPEFLGRQKSKSFRGDGKFRSYTHAPSTYAFKKYILNCAAAQLKIEKKFRERNHIEVIHQEQDSAKKLLSLSWFSRSKENFSWSPLIDGFVGHSSASDVILDATPNLEAHNKMVVLAMSVEEELNKENFDSAKIQANLTELKTLLNSHERNNIFIELFLALVGIIVAPLACLIGFIWIIPAYLYALPYLGKSSFFLDTFQWFIDSCLTTARCLIFPIAMIHAYNTTGSSNLLKGECTRIVEALLARIENTPARLSIQPFSTNDHRLEINLK